MSFITKLSIPIFAYLAYIFIGIGFQSNISWWGLLLSLAILIVYVLDYYVRRKNLYSAFLKYVPILLVSISVYGIAHGNIMLIDNPLSIEVIEVQSGNQIYDAIKFEYGIYETNVFDTKISNNLSALHNENLRPNPGFLRGFIKIVIFPGILIPPIVTLMFLSEKRTVKRHSKRRKLSETLMASSGSRFGGVGARTSHLQVQESFIQGEANAKLVEDAFYDEQVKNDK